MARKVLVLHTRLAPIAVAETLRDSIDEERWTLFSLSGYRGDRPLLGEVGETTFRVQKRKNYRNDFAEQFHGSFVPDQGGTRIEGYFDDPRRAIFFMRIWLAFAVVIGAPIFIRTVFDFVTGSHYVSGDRWVGLVVPTGLVLGGTLIAKIGRLNERFILERLESVLGAQVETSEPRIG